jgi:hypothetical protein
MRALGCLQHVLAVIEDINIRERLTYAPVSMIYVVWKAAVNVCICFLTSAISSGVRGFSSWRE